jgi:hypothetical protein
MVAQKNYPVDQQERLGKLSKNLAAKKNNPKQNTRDSQYGRGPSTHPPSPL